MDGQTEKNHKRDGLGWTDRHNFFFSDWRTEGLLYGGGDLKIKNISPWSYPDVAVAGAAAAGAAAPAASAAAASAGCP